MAHRKAPPVRNDTPKMRGPRARTDGGDLRRKRGGTRVDTIEHQHPRNFGVRGDMHLQTLLEKKGVESLSELPAKGR